MQMLELNILEENMACKSLNFIKQHFKKQNFWKQHAWSFFIKTSQDQRSKHSDPKKSLPNVNEQDYDLKE